jgi:hypothetical protein
MSQAHSVEGELVELRRHDRDDDEPLNAETMSVHYSGNSLVVGLTHFACVCHDLDETDTVTVETHDDGLWLDV